MKLSTSSSVAYASILACFGTLSAAAGTPTTNDSPSKVLDTRDPPGETLVGDYRWIRSVEQPYYHYYLQTDPQLEAASAIMGDPSTAAQWAIQDGQLVELVDTDGTVLYAHVAQPETEDARTLNVTLAAEPNSFGAFSWSGDALLWMVSSIDRPNNAAWLICEDDLLYVNLGAYGYQTPEGCADATIHAYGAATATW